MKHTKKFLVYACIGLLSVSALYGCGKKEPETEPQSQTQTEAQTQKETQKQTEPQTQQSETQKQTEPQTQQSEPQTETQAQSETSDQAQGSETSSKGEERYFFDEAGNTIYTSQNANGDWVDSNGTVYTFLEDGVKDSSGNKYYYDPPAYRGDSGVSGTDTGEAVDIYRNDGTYTRLTKDANGNWADSNGITYELREDGAMDSNGEFHPW